MKAKHVITGLVGVLLVLLCATAYYRQPFVKRIKDVVVTVHAVSHRSGLKAEYVVITRVKSKLTVEVIRGPGEENVDVMQGKKAQQYLDSVRLN